MKKKLNEAASSFDPGMSDLPHLTQGKSHVLASEHIKSQSSYVMVTVDPELKFQKLSLLQKVTELTTIVIIELYETPLLIVCMVGASITRLLSVLFSTYLVLWIQSFCIPAVLFGAEQIEKGLHNKALLEQQQD